MVDTVLIGFKHGVFAGFTDLVVNFLAGLFNHFLDPRRMDPAVHDQFFHSNPCHFTADRVKGGDDHGFRGIINDQVNTRGSFQRADVPAFTADDAALHVIVRQADHADSAFSHMVGCALLDRQGDDVAGFLFAFFLRLGFDLTNLGGGVMEGFLLDAVDHDLLRFIAAQAGDPFQFSHLLRFQLIQFRFFPGEISKLVVQGFFPGFQVAGFLVQGFFTLDQAAFVLLDLVAAFTDFPFVFRTFPVIFSLGLQDFLLGLQHFFLLVVFSLAHRVVIQPLGVVFSPFNLFLCKALPVRVSHQAAEQAANNRGNDRGNDWTHKFPPLLFRFSISYSGIGAQKKPYEKMLRTAVRCFDRGTPGIVTSSPRGNALPENAWLSFRAVTENP